MGPRSDPERTCVGCRGRAGKRELLRLARDPAGGVRVDDAARMPGRGAYIHPSPACAAAALRRGALGRALRTVVAPEEAARLEHDIMSMLGDR